jgi:hypothetical protein
MYITPKFPSSYHGYLMTPATLKLPFSTEPIGDVMPGRAVMRLAELLRDVARSGRPRAESFVIDGSIWTVDAKPTKSRVACETTWIRAGAARTPRDSARAAATRHQRVITLRLTADEHAQLRREAWERGVSLQRYLHALIFGQAPGRPASLRPSNS